MGKGSRNRAARSRAAAPASLAGKDVLQVARAGGDGRARQVSLAEMAQELTRPQPGVVDVSGQGLDYVPMPRNPLDLAPWGPLNPFMPSPVDPPRPDSGRPEPRLMEYPMAWNIELGAQKQLDWQTLRDAAASVDLIRACIEVRKKHIRDLEWSFGVSEDAVKAARQAEGGRDKATEDIEEELRLKYAADIERLTERWKTPWPAQDLDFGQWVNMVMEDYITLDGRVIHPSISFGGDLLGFEVIDPATIKILLDSRGGRPQPPFPAFQQLLYSFPRGEWQADVDEAGDIVSPFASDRMSYFIENARSFTVYGYSDVEQALIASKLYLLRQGWMITEHTDGSTPDTWLVPAINNATGMQANISMTSPQRQEYENALNHDLGGNSGQRHRVKLTPPGFTPVQMTQEAERYKRDYDMYLVQSVCKHMGVLPTELGYAETGGLGTTGQHEGQEASTGRLGTRPDVAVITEMVNKLSRRYMDAPPELCFRFTIAETEDEAAKDAVQAAQLKDGRLTLNEARRANGKAPYQGVAEADKPMLIQGATAILVDNIEAAQQMAAEQAQLAAEGGAALNSAKVVETETKAEVLKDPPAPKLPEGVPAKVAKAAKLPPEVDRELIAYARWLRKQAGPPRRPFEFSELAGEVLPALPEHSIVKAANLPLEGGGAGPKAPAPDRRWPAWEVDESLARTVAGRLIRGLIRGLGIPSLVERVLTWALHRPRGEELRPAVAGFLRAGRTAQDVHNAVDKALTSAIEQGYMVGNRSARAAVEHMERQRENRVRPPQAAASTLLRVPEIPRVDWASWTPGDEAAARLMLSADGAEVGMLALLERDNIRIKGIAETQLDLLAAVLADGIERGESPQAIAVAVRGLVENPKHAYRIAITEVNRAVSAATLDSYAAMGIKTKSWLSAFDQDVCPRCNKNVAAGELPLDERFPSGELHPPGHPHCRCALAPGHADLDDLSWLDAADDEMRAEGLLL